MDATNKETTMDKTTATATNVTSIENRALTASYRAARGPEAWWAAGHTLCAGRGFAVMTATAGVSKDTVAHIAAALTDEGPLAAEVLRLRAAIGEIAKTVTGTQRDALLALLSD